MNHIVETIGSWGVKTSPAAPRISTICAGDVVMFRDEHRIYPVSCRYCCVDHVNRKTGMIGLVDGMGSGAFIDSQARVSISGGPFFSLPLEFVEAAQTTHQVTVWNWGDHSPGAGQGVDYHIDRPLFNALASPNDFAIRYSRKGESDARQGGEYRHGFVPESAALVRCWAGHDDGTEYFLFDLR